MSGNTIRIERALHPVHGNPDRHNWLVFDSTGPKVFTRVLVFSYFAAAVKEADRLARTGLINPRALFGAQRRECGWDS